MDLFRAFQHNSSSSNSELLANADSQAGDTVVSLDSDFDEDATESASAGARPRKPIRATTTSRTLSFRGTREESNRAIVINQKRKYEEKLGAAEAMCQSLKQQLETLTLQKNEAEEKAREDVTRICYDRSTMELRNQLLTEQIEQLEAKRGRGSENRLFSHDHEGMSEDDMREDSMVEDEVIKDGEGKNQDMQDDFEITSILSKDAEDPPAIPSYSTSPNPIATSRSTTYGQHRRRITSSLNANANIEGGRLVVAGSRFTSFPSLTAPTSSTIATKDRKGALILRRAALPEAYSASDPIYEDDSLEWERESFNQTLFENRDKLLHIINEKSKKSKGPQNAREEEEEEEEDNEKRKYHVRVTRNVFKKFFSIDSYDDFASRKPVDDAVAKSFEVGIGNGPSALDNRIDTNSQSLWNSRIVELLAEEVLLEPIGRDKNGRAYSRLSKRDYEKLLQGNLRRAITAHKSAKPMFTAPGVLETSSQASRRFEETKTKRDKQARQNKRRQTVYQTRVRSLDYMLHSREGDPHGDLHLWEDINHIIKTLDIDGMSSDESDTEGHEVISRIKRLPWRRDIESYLNLIDGLRYDISNSDYSLRGKEPRRRIRGGNMISRRQVKINLPRSFYDETWLSKPGRDSMKVLHSLPEEEEDFKWPMELTT